MSDPPDIRELIAAIKRSPSSAKHLTPELEQALTNDEPQIWLRAALVLCEAWMTDPLASGSDKKVSNHLISMLKFMIAHGTH